MKGVLIINNVFRANEKDCYLLSVTLKKGILNINDYIFSNGKKVYKIIDIEIHFLAKDESAMLTVRDLDKDVSVPWGSGEEYHFEADTITGNDESE